MRKIIVSEELICPFDKCRISLINESKDIDMGIKCLTCEYVWNRNSKVNIKEGYLYLDKNSKEYKEYELLHTPICVGEI